MLIILNTIPTAQQRSRHAYVKALGRSVTYKASSQKRNENTLEALLTPSIPNFPMQGAISLFISCCVKMPKSFSKKKVEELDNTFCTKKPDIDNFAKNIMDCLTRLRFWEDDAQVVSLHAEKKYSREPKWIIEIKEIKEDKNNAN